MTLFLQLYLGHLLGDYALQPGRLVVAKRHRAIGLLVHAVIIGGITAAVVLPRTPAAWAAVLFATSAHLVVEMVSIAAYTGTPTRSVYVFILDQTLHVLTLALIVQLLAGTVAIPAAAFGVELGVRGLAVVCGLLTVTLLGGILTFEAGNSLPSEEGVKGDMLCFDQAWAGGVVERASSFALALVSPALMALPFLPRTVVALRRAGRDRVRLLLQAATGLGLCVFSWALVSIASGLGG